jgi:hypothetical protein
MTLITIIHAVAFSICFAFRNYHQKNELISYRVDPEAAEAANRQWHKWQGAIQLLAALPFLIFAFKSPVWQDFILWLSIYWLVFDNLLAFKLTGKFPYLGGGWIDEQFKRWGDGQIVKFLIQVALVMVAVAIYNF